MCLETLSAQELMYNYIMNPEEVYFLVTHLNMQLMQLMPLHTWI